MKSVNELGISSMPWVAMDNGTVASQDTDGELFEVCDCWGHRDEANARLIAAAPELYECLREAALIEQCHDAETHCDLCHTSSSCRAYRWKKALAKAEGEEAAK